ncbi:MAG: FMN-binding negative transcriptional regulator [Caldilineaceae bacterium]
MYIPNSFKIAERKSLLAYMRNYSFATLISVIDGSPFASHLPLVVEDAGETIRLKGHFAKANPHWRAHEQGGGALVIFQGPHAYIAPAQYEASEAVPTWNYVAVHAYGELRLLPAGESTIAMLEQMFDTFDATYRTQWQTLSEKFKNGMLNGIVAFEIVVDRLEGKAKLSQNRPAHDQANVAAWLLTHEDGVEQEVGRLMQQNLEIAGGV